MGPRGLSSMYIAFSTMALAVYDALGKVVGARLVLGRGERRV